ncbi:MAG TPA: DUF3999 family protein [Ideonella sp.]|nr:DUF3999 family protein [Ideonella sp.]
MRRLEWLVAVLACGLGAAARADEAAYRYTAPIVVQQGAAFVQMPLPASAYGHSQQPGLRDLRVVDARGERVPFALLEPRASALRNTELQRDAALYPLPARPVAGGTWPSPVEVTVQGDRISVRQRVGAPATGSASPGWLFDLGEHKPGDAPPSSLRLAWSGPAEFSASFSLEMSDDLRQWREAGAGQVMALASAGGALSQPSVMLPPSPGRFVRLVWSDPATAPVLTGAKGVATQLSQEALDAPSELVFSPSPEPAGKQPPGNEARRALHFDLGGALPLRDVDLQLGSGTRVAPVRLQGRNSPDEPWQGLGGTVFYQLQREGSLSHSPPLPLQASLRYLRVLPDERAAALDPAQTRLVVHAALASLVFTAQGQAPLALWAGAPKAADSALPLQTLVPDLAQERARFGRATLGAWSEVAAVAQQAAAEQRSARWRPWLLWAVLLAGVAGLGVMVWRLALRSSAS